MFAPTTTTRTVRAVYIAFWGCGRLVSMLNTTTHTFRTLSLSASSAKKFNWFSPIPLIDNQRASSILWPRANAEPGANKVTTVLRKHKRVKRKL